MMLNEDQAFMVGDRVSLANITIHKRAGYENMLNLIFSKHSQAYIISSKLASNASFLQEKQSIELS